MPDAKIISDRIAAIMGDDSMSITQLREALSAQDLYPPDSYLAALLNNTMTNVLGPTGQPLCDSDGNLVKARRFKMIAQGIWQVAVNVSLSTPNVRTHRSSHSSQ